MPFTKRITIERYKEPGEYGGLIEGETDDGKRWIMFVDDSGRPSVFWPERDEDGGVKGDGIKLGRVPGQFSGVFSMLGVQDDADSWDENGPVNPEVVACFPVWHPGKDIPVDANGVYPPDTMRGVVFAVVPGDGDIGSRMRRFITELGETYGLTNGEQRAQKMRQIIQTEKDPEKIVKRITAALDAMDSIDERPDVREAVDAILEHNTTQETVALSIDGLPESDVRPPAARIGDQSDGPGEPKVD